MEDKFTYPGIFSRLMSFTYDIFLVVALWFLVGAIFTGLYQLIISYREYIPSSEISLALKFLSDAGYSNYLPPPIGPLIIILTTAGYYVYFWSHGRNTLGMSTWNHKIINDDGSKLSRIVALKRFLLYLLLSALGMLWILFDRENKCLPDRILKLKIVKRKTAS